MAQTAVVIPEKIYFKIGEVCGLVGVQAHVLRYWETEFPMLSPQKNRSGQRSYRRRDVEISLRIKQLLYDEMFTIAGAKRKLHNELRETTKLKIDNPKPMETDFAQTAQPNPGLFEEELNLEKTRHSTESDVLSGERRDALKLLAAQLLELREMLKTTQTEEATQHLRNH